MMTALVGVLQGYSRLHGVTARLQKAHDHACQGTAKRGQQRVRGRSHPHAVTQRLGSSSVLELVAAYEAGATSVELAELYGVSRTAVKDLLHREGIVVRRPSGLSAADVDEAVRLYQRGWLLREIAVKFAVHQETVRRALVQRKIVRRSGHGSTARVKC